MTELPDIISSPVINQQWDSFWNELPETVQQLPEKPLLVLSQAYTDGSAEAIQLQKMLQACTLTESSYNIVQLSSAQNIPWHKLKEQFKPKTVLLLGVIPEQLGISAMFRLFMPNNFDSAIWIAGLSLTELEKQPEAKKQLWQNGLKPVFVDKTIGNF